MIDEFIDAAVQDIRFTDDLIGEFEIPSDLKSRIAGSLFHVAREHQKAIILLLAHSRTGSAFALMRPLFESYVRGVWFKDCTNDDAVELFAKGNEPPKISVMLKELEKNRSTPGQHPIRYKIARMEGDVRIHTFWNSASLETPNRHTR